jgi:HEAT repeat protein
MEEGVGRLVTPAELRQYVQHNVQQLDGDSSGNAWHSLREASEAALPYVIAAFAASTRRAVRVSLIEIIGEYRNTEATPFLAAQLTDDDGEIWKAALDGLVKLGDHAAADALQTALLECPAERRDWIVEAIDQIRNRE